MKGSNEIATCIYNTILKKTIGVCDENRNRIKFIKYFYAAKNMIVNIKRNFLEPGHTQNEGNRLVYWFIKINLFLLNFGGLHPRYDRKSVKISIYISIHYRHGVN